MDLRKDVQKLAIWYIPIALATTIVSMWWSGMLKEEIIDGNLSVGTFSATLSYIGTGLLFSGRLVVAIWLYFMVSKSTGNKYIWFMFGLAASLPALIIFIAIAIYENTASNK